MDAIGILEKDHQDARKVLEEISGSSGLKKKKLFDALKRELELHNAIEERIFYPAVLANAKTAGLPAQDAKAHKVVEDALEQLAKMPVEDPNWTRDFNAMQDKLLKHVSDEEKIFFVKIREILGATELVELGEKMLTAKDQQLYAI